MPAAQNSILKVMRKSKNAVIGAQYGHAKIVGPPFRCRDVGSKYATQFVVALCRCGNHFAVRINQLAAGKCTSCGCLHKVVVAGETFGRLTAIRKTSNSPSRWLCRCTCGTEKSVNASHLLQGNTRSCGCLKNPAKTHGKTKTREFTSWQGMLGRCYTPTNKKYPSYGGRGISVCPRWKNSFEAFLQDMGPRPSPQHSIDRIDNDGNYEPGNCRWATPKEQSRNRRSNVLLTHNGKTQTVVEWSEETGISKYALLQRIQKLKWSTEEALTRPVQEQRSRGPATTEACNGETA